MERLLHIWTLQKSIKKETVSSRGGRAAMSHSDFLSFREFASRRSKTKLAINITATLWWNLSQFHYSIRRTACALDIPRESSFSPLAALSVCEWFLLWFLPRPQTPFAQRIPIDFREETFNRDDDWLNFNATSCARCFDIELAMREFFSRGTSDEKLIPRRVATNKCKSPAFVERNQSEALTSRKPKGKTVVRGMCASNCLIY